MIDYLVLPVLAFVAPAHLRIRGNMVVATSSTSHRIAAHLAHVEGNTKEMAEELAVFDSTLVVFRDDLFGKVNVQAIKLFTRQTFYPQISHRRCTFVTLNSAETLRQFLTLHQEKSKLTQMNEMSFIVSILVAYEVVAFDGRAKQYHSYSLFPGHQCLSPLPDV